VQQLLRRGGLEQETADAGAQCLGERAVLVEGRADDDAVSEKVLGSPLEQLCSGLDPLLLPGLPLVIFGQCRAGGLGWWALASVIAGTVLLPFSPTSTNLVVAAAFLLIQLPLAVAGVRLVARIWLHR